MTGTQHRSINTLTVPAAQYLITASTVSQPALTSLDMKDRTIFSSSVGKLFLRKKKGRYLVRSQAQK